ncbi:MAG: insulinase family protein [Clostridiales bacterium]|nr:insulinase family protein [Clostridiales bacterium]
MKIYFKQLQNGTKCYIIYKGGYKTVQAVFSVNFGSAEPNCIPGSAHFLEHKVFEQKDKNVMKEFSENSAEVNAYTNFGTTAYYFTCDRNFEENLKLLLDFTTNPYLTDENVEKEKGIIEEEIKMYEDDPWWQVYFNLLRGPYVKNPVRNNIAGTRQDIRKINKDALEECYGKYYCGENSALVICGDVDIDKTFSLADSFVSLKKGEKRKETFFEDEGINKSLYMVKMDISKPNFNLGFKENNFELSSEDRLCETRLLLDVICGKSSELYEKLYLRGLIDKDFSMEYLLGNNFGGAIISGVSERAEAAADEILRYAERLKNRGIDENLLENSRKRLISAHLRGQNCLNGLAAAQTDYAFKGLKLTEICERYKTITKDDIINRLDIINGDNLCLSIVGSL